MRGRIFLAILACLTFVAPAATTSTAAANSSATLSQPLTNWLSTASATDRFNTIITFYDRSSMGVLDSKGIAANRLHQLPIAFAKLTPAQIRELASSSAVRSLWHDQKQEIYLDESVALTKADKVHRGEGLRNPAGYSGAGIGVGVIDTGVDSLHPDLPWGTKAESFAIAGNPDLFDEGNHEPNFVASVPTVDTYGHGTHVASTVAGLGTASGGRYKGMAPGAKIFSYKTDAGAFLLTGWALASFDHMLAHNAAGSTPQIKVSTNSWGSGDGTTYNPDDPINVTTKALYDSGVTVLFAASNSGAPNTLNQYATSPWVVSVAAGTKDLKLASFSSRGRFDDADGTVDVNWNRRTAQRNNSGIYRPTVTAPGVDINAAKSAQAVVMASGTDPENPFYTYADGTSMATPHVAGAVALMLQARPALQPQHVIDILEGTADNMPSYELFEVGMGHLDAHEAVQAAEKGKIKFPPSVNGATPEFTRISATPIQGVAMTNTWALVEQEPAAQKCLDNDATALDDNLYSHHRLTIAIDSGTDLAYAEIDWNQGLPWDVTGPTDLLYLRLYAPDCTVASESAALLDIGDVNHRAVMATNPVPGIWTVAVYGRVNAPNTPYTGLIGLYDKN